MKRVARVELEAGSFAAMEVHQCARGDGWLLALVVPARELPAFGMTSVHDLVELAGELRAGLLREHVA